jgi:hypothetical protein
LDNGVQVAAQSAAAPLDALILGIRTVQFAVKVVITAALGAFLVANLATGLAVVGRSHRGDPAQGEGQGHKNGQGHGTQLVHCSSSLMMVDGGAAEKVSLKKL